MNIENKLHLKVQEVAELIKNGTVTLLDWAWYYYHVRKWHIMPKKKGEKHTYLQYVTKDNKAEERYSWESLEKEFIYRRGSVVCKRNLVIDGIILKTGFVKDATSVTALDYDPRNDKTGKGKEIIDKLPQEGVLITETGRGDGGVHILCEYDPELPNGPLSGTGIEIKNGALLVLPPSAHTSGGFYRFKEINHVVA